MSIQLITGNKEFKNTSNIIISDYSSPRALDDFEIDIVDLSFGELWKSRFGYDSLDRNNDLSSIASMVNRSEAARILYVYPQNIKHLYSLTGGNYNNKILLKDILALSNGHLRICKCFPDYLDVEIMFEPTITIIEDEECKADFHFENDYFNTVTRSKKSNKPTTILLNDRIYLTTIDICKSVDCIEKYVKYVFFRNQDDVLPEWVKEYVFGNDIDQESIIENCNEQIIELKKKIDDAEEKIKENMRYKSILYNNGDELVSVVFDILQKLFEYDLSEFVDEKREDFIIKKNGLVFIGEIKGVTSNVKNEHISQLDVHCQSYIDEELEQISEDNVHGLLIINPFRTKKLEEREAIHERQIKLALRNKSLIIETCTLLKLFELFQKGCISSDECINIFTVKIGLLSIEDFGNN